MEQVVAKDASSESIETIAPFLTIVDVDTTFVSSVETGKANILIASSRLM